MTPWPEHRVGDLCMPTELRDPRRDPADTFRYVDIAGIDRTTKTIVEPPTLLGAEAPSRARKVIRADDVLVSTVRPNLNAVAMVPEELDGEVASTGFSILRAHRELLEPRYLFYRTISPDFVAALTSRVRGASYPAVSDRDVKSVEIRLPPLAEQRRIVEILDQADHLRQLRFEAAAKLERLLPALFLKMFGDPATNPMSWPIRPLGRIAEVVSGGAFPRNEQGRSEGELPFIKVSDMNLEGNEWFINRANNFVSADTLNRLRVRPAPAGSTVFPKIGAAIGTNKKRLLVRPTAFDNNVIGVTPCDPAFSSYLFGFFQLFDLRRLARATAVPSIRASELSALPVPKPSLAAVSSFSAQLGGLTEVRAAADQGRRVVDDLFKVLAHRAFRGHFAGLSAAAGRTTGVREGATPRQAQPETAPEEGRCV